MKGNQGLEALANLCNNARKSTEGQDASSSEQSSQQTQRSNPLCAASQDFRNSALNYPSNVSSHLHQNQSQSFNGISPNMANLIKTMGSNMNQHQASTNVLGSNNDTMTTLQQLAYIQNMNSLSAPSVLQLMNANAASQSILPHSGVDPSAAVSALLAATQGLQGGGSGNFLPNSTTSAGQAIADNSSMQPPQFQPARNASGQSASVSHQPILMRNASDLIRSDSADELVHVNGDNAPAPGTHDKKSQKRAANRRSAQLSRKRKKQFIEELKEENDDLRRKEQILRSIPDLIVVFDSSGKLGFVSHSVSNFLEFTPNELVGTSFWERLCEGSVRLLKAAFMDALAARTRDHETTPLGSGVWELRLQDKNGNFVLVTLNGVVHFSGEAPECVCSIRPMKSGNTYTGNDTNTNTNNAKTDTIATATKPNSKRNASELVLGTIKPEQSVVKTDVNPSQRNVRPRLATGPDGSPAPISDVDSGTSVVSSEGRN